MFRMARESSMTRSPAKSGFATLELASWCLIILPILLMGADTLGMAHDQNVTHTVAAETTREVAGHALSWHSDGNMGIYQVDYDTLRATIDSMADRALVELSTSSLFLMDASVVACYWVVSVHPTSGLIESDEAMSCAERGPRAQELSLVEHRAHVPAESVGNPNPVSVGDERFAPKAILIGVQVGGRFRGVSPLTGNDLMKHGVIRSLREEMAL